MSVICIMHNKAIASSIISLSSLYIIEVQDKNRTPLSGISFLAVKAG